ncbi:MAG: family peptidase, partial [Planctomycetaceae bacterium]|nr:family peptidase [Planctomycetaceae bacterium]
MSPHAVSIPLPALPPAHSPRPELLSPAGEWEALKAAVANGADAVYFGLSDFNARHRATNFTVEELPQVMRYLHDHNVRGYVTCNTLIFSDELPQITEYVKALAMAGVDAVIVQDLGLARLIRRLAPQLTVHGSTQMTLTDVRGVEFVRKMGVERVILARELSVKEIGEISAGTTLPLEVFIHGALCVAYSGQCLTSESLGGRSANRGQCAQACRLPYDLIVDGEQREMGEVAYLLSPQDLAAPDLIDDLVQAGVACFKIEGRLKSAQYVAATTQTYRTALDAALESRPFEMTHEQSLALQQSFSRGFSHGFLSGVDHQELVQGRFPKSRGVRLGTVVERTSQGVIIELHAQHVDSVAAAEDGTAWLPVKPGDGVVFDEGHPDQDEQGGRVVDVQANASRQGTPRVELIFHAGTVNLASLAIGCLVWKTDDPALRRRLEQTYNRDEVRHRVRIDARVYAAVGEPLRVEFRDAQGSAGLATNDQILEAAVKVPLKHAVLREQLARLGDTPFELGDVVLETSAGTVPEGTDLAVMVPKSLLNDLRRQAVQNLRAERLQAERRDQLCLTALDDLRASVIDAAKNVGVSGDADATKNVGHGAHLTVLVRNLEQLQAVLDSPGVSLVYCDFEEVRRYEAAVKMARAAGVPIALATLRVVKPSE